MPQYRCSCCLSPARQIGPHLYHDTDIQFRAAPWYDRHFLVKERWLTISSSTMGLAPIYRFDKIDDITTTGNEFCAAEWCYVVSDELRALLPKFCGVSWYKEE